MHAATHSRESIFHDQWAASVEVNRIGVAAAFESPTAVENKFILRKMGDLRGKRILDIGCGLGESPVYFAKRGADVTATDISPGMIESTTRLAAHHGVSIATRVGSVESLDLPAKRYDFVYSANTLHHVPDRVAFLDQIARTLRSGGRLFTWDPLAYNPIINVYRRMATQVRTPDERPLRFCDLDLFRARFARVEHREFWITTLALFLKYYVVDRVHPNSERYWKKIYGETEATLWWWLPLRSLDGLLTRTPLFKRLAWNIVISATKS